jgi:hypothetical protein
MALYLSYDYQCIFFLSHMHYLGVWADKKRLSILRDLYASFWNFPHAAFLHGTRFLRVLPNPRIVLQPTVYATLFVPHRLNPVMASRLVAGLVVQVTLNRVPLCPGSGFATCDRKWKWGSLKYKVCETRRRIYIKGMLSVLICLWPFVYRVNQDISIISLPTSQNDVMLCMITQPTLHSRSIKWIHERDTSVDQGPSPFTCSYMFHRRIPLLQEYLNWKLREKVLFWEETF